MKKKYSMIFVTALTWLFSACGNPNSTALQTQTAVVTEQSTAKQVEKISELDADDYDGEATVEVNDGIPFFSKQEKTCTDAFETYSDLDELGRCGVAYANICKEIMPTEKRENIGSVKPTAWHTVKYDCVEGMYLYNRCHLLAFELAGENANEKNLITGTRYMNIDGMLEKENEVAGYVKSTGNHVLYRVTPVYEGDNLLAEGVLMEAYSVEDKGKGIEFCQFAYNVQPEITINYSDGESQFDKKQAKAKKNKQQETDKTENAQGQQIDSDEEECEFVLNTNSKKYHRINCSSVKRITKQNKQSYKGTRSWLEENGYTACGNCNP